MPQQSMFPTTPPLVAVRLTVEDRSPQLDPSWALSLETRLLDHPWQSLHSAAYQGTMLDFATTWASESVATFMFEEGRRDLLRTAQSVHRAAVRHQRRFPGGF